jgi:pseudouridine-5'-monophosphatase
MCLELKYKCFLCSSRGCHFDLKATKHGSIFALMHHIVVEDDPAVVHGKPLPDVFLIAAQ